MNDYKPPKMHFKIISGVYREGVGLVETERECTPEEDEFLNRTQVPDASLQTNESMDWWKDPKNQITEISNEEWSIGTLVGRETPDGWEYALVSHRYHECFLTKIFKNGKLLENSDKTQND